MPTRCVAFIYLANSVPTSSVLARESLARPHMSRLQEWASRRAGKYADKTEAGWRLDGWAIGSEEFRRQYKVQADDRRAAEWLLGSGIQERLLADPTVSLSSIGSDVLAWCDRGFGGDGFDIRTVDRLIELLDVIELPR